MKSFSFDRLSERLGSDMVESPARKGACEISTQPGGGVTK